MTGPARRDASAVPRNAWQRLPSRVRRRVLDAVISRDGAVCWTGCGRRATEVDHIRPISAGGAPTDLDNCRASCGPCNRTRGAAATGDGAYGAVLVTGPDRPADAVLELDMDRLAAALVGSEDPPAEALQVVAAAAYHAAVLAARRLTQPITVWARPPRQVEPAAPAGPARPESVMVNTLVVIGAGGAGGLVAGLVVWWLTRRRGHDRD